MNENKRDQEFKGLGAVIDKIMKAYQLDGKLREMQVLEQWEEMMGKAVAQRTKNLRIQQQVLYIELDSAVMREELLHGKSVIIQRINETAGFEMIKEVYFA